MRHTAPTGRYRGPTNPQGHAPQEELHAPEHDIIKEQLLIRATVGLNVPHALQSRSLVVSIPEPGSGGQQGIRDQVQWG